MCVIICVDDGKYPSKDTLRSAEDMNSHGGSIAWLNKDGTKSYKKGITAKRISKIINGKLIPQGLTTAIIHFRIASVGGVKRNLNHPFEISSKVELNMEKYNTTKDLLFHNGTWGEYTEVLVEYLKTCKNTPTIPRGNYSDSRVMAYLAHKIGAKNMARKVVGFNKVAILTSKGIVKYGAGWCNYKGNKCSNDYFVPTLNTWSFDSVPAKHNDTFVTKDPLGYLNSDELIEMTNIMDIYGLTAEEIAEMMSDGTSIYDIGCRIELEDDRMASMNFEDEVANHNGMNGMWSQ
jgi:hypothetical protein